MMYLQGDEKHKEQSKKHRARYHYEFIKDFSIDALPSQVITNYPNQPAQGVCNHVRYVRRPNCEDVLDSLCRNAGDEHDEQLAPETQAIEVDAQQQAERDKDKNVFDRLN